MARLDTSLQRGIACGAARGPSATVVSRDEGVWEVAIDIAMVIQSAPVAIDADFKLGSARDRDRYGVRYEFSFEVIILRGIPNADKVRSVLCHETGSECAGRRGVEWCNGRIDRDRGKIRRIGFRRSPIGRCCGVIRARIGD
ncbi:MAG: hypothetical protein CBC48_13440 [bacterium TMED88]|nr:hypothetical protein [Deltaproteobacteria bacterium]OUV28374.1 MAG: hypothetical protein CBC48_13440 [bacterium TMED88]